MGYRGQEKEYIVCTLKMFMAQWKENLKLTNGKIPLWYTKSSLVQNCGKILETIIFNRKGKFQFKCTYQHKLPLSNKIRVSGLLSAVGLVVNKFHIHEGTGNRVS